MRRNDVASTSFRRRVPTRFLIKQCQIITFLILKYDIIENSRIELRGIVLPVQVGGLLGGGGGQRVCWPPSHIYCPPPPPPPISYAYGFTHQYPGLLYLHRQSETLFPACKARGCREWISTGRMTRGVLRPLGRIKCKETANSNADSLAAGAGHYRTL